jgi:hypothetical protein
MLVSQLPVGAGLIRGSVVERPVGAAVTVNTLKKMFLMNHFSAGQKPTTSEAVWLKTEIRRNMSYPPAFATPAEERQERKRKLTAALRVFGKFGFDEGVAGHCTVRDPERLDHFWVNPFGRSFKQMRVSDLILVNHDGEIVEGDGLLNQAAFAIHSQIHKNLPHVTAVAHTHSLYGKAWACLGRLLDPQRKILAPSMKIMCYSMTIRVWCSTPQKASGSQQRSAQKKQRFSKITVC